MDNKYTDHINSRTDFELKNIVVNSPMYQGALINAAKIELAKRGIELTDQEKALLEENRVKKIRANISGKESDKSWGLFSSPDWKINITTDPDAPKLYSRLAVWIFSISFSVICGGILLSINLKKTGNKKAILQVMAFSIVYTALLIIALNQLEKRSTVLTLGFNAIGGFVLSNLFWGKYIGKDLKYRTRASWLALIIGISITAFFILIGSMGQ
jgi:hypothetical protein